MTVQGQYGCVLAALLVCLVLTIGLVGAPPPAAKPAPAGGDDIPFPTWDVPTWDPKSSSARPRVPTAIVPEGVAVLLVTVVWTAGRALLSSKLGSGAPRRTLTTLGHRRSFG
jgi:hypothetical protein